MADSADEFGEAQEEVALQVGDSVVVYAYPLTEGLIIDRRSSDDGRLALTLLIAPFQKKGRKWSKTKVSIRDAARLSKKPPGNFVFPISGVERLREEAKKVKADPIWVSAVKAALDKEFKQSEVSPGDSDQDNKDEGEESEEGEKLSTTQQKKGTEESMLQKFAELEKRMGEVLQLKARGGATRKKRKDKESEDSDYEQWKKWKKENKKRKQRLRRRKAKPSSSPSSSSSSSSSSSEGEFRSGEVGERGSSGLFSCPFYKSDVRGVQDVKGYIHGQETTRKHIRIALHNLYAAHHTLVSFADKFVSQAYSSPNRPYSMDVAWFEAYAENLDEALLNSLHGPWALWNEPVIDQLTLGFLDLMVRVSPYKNFPVCLHDSVRKWLKKQRIGTNAKFGPVSYAMQHAKFTEAGVVLQQASGQKLKERSQNSSRPGQSGSMGTNVTNNRSSTGPSGGGEKRAPPPS